MSVKIYKGYHIDIGYKGMCVIRLKGTVVASAKSLELAYAWIDEQHGNLW